MKGWAHHKGWIVGASVVATIGVSACSSSSKGAATNTGNTSPSSASSPSSSTDNPATGTPIKITMITGTGPGTAGSEAIPGAQAAVSDVNAKGGVNGHPLNLTVCDAKTDANLAGQCARTAVADPDQVAVVGSDLYGYTAQEYAALEQAKMASVGVKPFGTAENTSPISFPIEAGALASLPAGVVIGSASGLKGVAIVTVNVPSSSAVDTFIKTTLVPQLPSGAYVGMTLIPITQTDMQATAADMIRKSPGGIYVGLPTAQAISYINTVRQQGFTGTLLVPASVITGDQIKSELQNPGKLIITGDYSHQGSGWDAFVAGMKKYQPSAAVNEQATQQWIAVHQFADVAKSISGTVTRASVLAAYQQLTNYSTGGLTPPLTYTTEAPYKGFNRQFNPTAVPLQYSNGDITNVQPTQFINIFTGKPVQAG